MVTKGLTLIAMRTARTPTLDTATEEKLSEVKKRYLSRYPNPPPEEGMRFTTETCKALDIALYRIKHSDKSEIARRLIPK